MLTLKVLIAEDDLMIADMTEEILVEQGFEVCGIARTVSEAVALALHHKPQLAVIDVRLADGGLGSDIVNKLGPLGRVGILYASASISRNALTSADGDASLSKPYRSADLVKGLEIVADLVVTRIAVPPFPRGFRLLSRVAGPILVG